MMAASTIHTPTAARQLTARLALRQDHIGQPEEDRRGVDRQACQRALGDEGGVVVEREDT